MFDVIGAPESNTAEFREMTTEELCADYEPNDYFRFSFTMRLGRNNALQIAKLVESFISNEVNSDVRVYLGIKNDRA